MLGRIHRFILHHDESKAFIVLYIGLAVILAIFLGLFWLTVVVGVHLLMEMVKQRHRDPRLLPVLTRSLWELKLDIGLVLCGLVIGLYIDVLFGIVGLSHLGRAGAQAAARVGMWPRVLRGALLTLDDVALVAKGAAVRKKAPSLDDAAALEQEPASGVVAEGAMLAATGTFGASGGPPATPAADALTGSLGAGEPEAMIEADAAEDLESKLSGRALWGGWTATRWGLGDKISLGFTALNLLLILAAPLLTDHSTAEVFREILSDLRPFPDH